MFSAPQLYPSGLSKEFENVAGIVFAGGSVIGTLTEGTIGDIDIFLTCAVEQCRAED